MNGKVVFSLLLLAALLIFAWLEFGNPIKSTEPSNRGAEQAGPPSVERASASADVVFPVEVAIARRGNLIKSLRTSGIVRAKRNVEILSRVSGEIVSLSVRNGSYVKAGDLLLTLDDREYRLAFERASNGLLAAQIEYKTQISYPYFGQRDSVEVGEQLRTAERALRDAEKLYQNRMLSYDEYLRRRRDYETELAYYKAKREDVIANKSGLSQAREAYERAKMNLEWTEVRAPFSGYIADLDLSIGTQVQLGKAVCKLVDVSTLSVDAEILESEAGRVSVGSRAEVSVNALPDETFAGKIISINPIVDPKTKTVRVTIELKDGRASRNRQSTISNFQFTILRPGMFANVRVESEILKDRLLVPIDALLVRDQRNLVFVADNGLAKWHYVEVGERNEQFLEIKSGITKGDSVLVSGHYTLAHDAKIKLESR